MGSLNGDSGSVNLEKDVSMKKWLRKNLKNIIEPIIKSSLVQSRSLQIQLPIELDGKTVDYVGMEASPEFEGMVHTLNHQHMTRARDGFTKVYDVHVQITERKLGE